MRRRLLLVLLRAALLFAAHANAATMTYNISFTAYDQIAASGSYTLTLDPTLNYTDATTGLVVNSLSDGLTPPAITGFNYDAGAQVLVIGGLLNGVFDVNAGTNDYVVAFTSVFTNPDFFAFIAGSVAEQNDLYQDFSGTVNITQVATTPEPSSFVLLGTGLLGVAGAVRRRLA